MYSERDLLPLSGAQHFVFCPRRAALVHIEGIWEENLATAKGRVSHERAHEQGTESRGDIRIARGLLLRSLELGLTGKADVVEFHRIATQVVDGKQGISPADGVVLDGADGLWRPFPVEYKSGKLRHERTFEVQLCAQAMCLEEMLRVFLAGGAIFYGTTGRRAEVLFDDALRDETRAAAEGFHHLVKSGRTPRASYSAKCKACSLLPACIPKVTGTNRTVHKYLKGALS